MFPGAEQASITVRTNIQVAQSQVEEARRVSADAEKKLAETKVDEIQRMAEYTASFDDEEHEVQEAYLREDWGKCCRTGKTRRACQTDSASKALN